METRMTRLFSLTLLTLSILFFSTPLEAQKYPQKASPFDEVRWKNNQPEVRIDETWYSPISVDGVEVSKIIAACEKRWRGQLQKRFTEDLMDKIFLDVLSKSPKKAPDIFLTVLEILTGDEFAEFMTGYCPASTKAKIITSLPKALFTIAAIRRTFS